MSHGFTTCFASKTPGVAVVDLADKVLAVHRVSSGTTHVLTSPPAPVPDCAPGAAAWEAFFPAGSINPGNKIAPAGGLGFYLHGPGPFAKALKELRDDAEVVFSSDVLFEEGFDWVKGGKHPGICE